MTKRVMSILTVLCLMVLLIPSTVIADGSVKYMKNGQELTCDEYTVIDSSSADELTLTSGWFVIDGDVELNNICLDAYNEIDCEINFILKDDSKLTINGHIEQSHNSAILNIYGQANGTGELIAKTTDGNGGIRAARLNVYGGIVKSSTEGTETWSRGVSCSYMNVYGGSVIAEGGAYGIYAVDAITISGDAVVEARVNDELEAKSGLYAYRNSITVSDEATVEAIGGTYGINSNEGEVIVSGGSVTAQGSDAAIGGSLTIRGNADVMYGEDKNSATEGTKDDILDSSVLKYVEIHPYVLDIFTKATVYDEENDVFSEIPLGGAKLSLIDSDNKVIDTWESGTEAYRIKSLDPGDYIINIDTCPEGYYYEDEKNSVRKVLFSVTNEGEVTSEALSGTSEDGFSICFNRISNYFFPLKDNMSFQYGDQFGVNILDLEKLTYNGEELSDSEKAMAGQAFYVECKDSQGNKYSTKDGALVPVGEYTVKAISTYDPEDGPVTCIYDFGSPVTTKVVPRVITAEDIESVEIEDKTYDPSDKANINANAIVTLKEENPQNGYTGGIQKDFNGKDKVEVVVVAYFVDLLPGNDKTVNYTITALTGEDAENYSLPEGGIAGEATGNITVDPSFVPVDKDGDGTPDIYVEPDDVVDGVYTDPTTGDKYKDAGNDGVLDPMVSGGGSEEGTPGGSDSSKNDKVNTDKDNATNTGDDFDLLLMMTIMLLTMAVMSIVVYVGRRRA